MILMYQDSVVFIAKGTCQGASPHKISYFELTYLFILVPLTQAGLSHKPEIKLIAPVFKALYHTTGN